MLAEFTFDTLTLNTLSVLAFMILGDAILGILLAIKNQEFDPYKLPEFFTHNMLPILGGLVFVGISALFVPAMKVVFSSVSVGVGLKYVPNIVAKLSELLGIEIDVPVFADHLSVWHKTKE